MKNVYSFKQVLGGRINFIYIIITHIIVEFCSSDLEGLEHRLVRQRGSCTFSLHYFHENVIPSGCRIKFKSSNYVESSIIRKAELAIVNKRIRQCNKNIDKLKEEIVKCKN